MIMSNINNLHYVKKLIENRKTLEKGLTPEQKIELRNKQVGGDAGSRIGGVIRARRAEDAKKYRGVRTKSTGEYAYTRGEVLNDPKRVNSGLAAHLALYGSPKVKDKANKKWKEINASTEVTYRDGIRALFETGLLESKAARKKAVRAKLAAAGHKQERIGARDRGTVVNVAGPRTGDDEFIGATVLNKSYTDHLKASADAKKAGNPSPSFPPPRNTRIRKWQPPPDKDAPRAPWWQQNSSTQITYRNGIKALFESVLDEGVMKRAFMDTQDDSEDDGGEAEAQARAEGEARATAAKADDAQKQYDAYKADQLRALTHGRKGVKLEKPKINMGTSDKPKMKQLDWTQNIRKEFNRLVSESIEDMKKKMGDAIKAKEAIMNDPHHPSNRKGIQNPPDRGKTTDEPEKKPVDKAKIKQTALDIIKGIQVKDPLVPAPKKEVYMSGSKPKK